MPRSREHEETPAAGRETNAEGPKKHIYVHVYKFPLRDVCYVKIPGLTQVDEKGHQSNTAVATAYLCWVENGQRKSRTGVPVDHCYLL